MKKNVSETLCTKGKSGRNLPLFYCFRFAAIWRKSVVGTTFSAMWLCANNRFPHRNEKVCQIT